MLKALAWQSFESNNLTKELGRCTGNLIKCHNSLSAKSRHVSLIKALTLVHSKDCKWLSFFKILWRETMIYISYLPVDANCNLAKHCWSVIVMAKPFSLISWILLDLSQWRDFLFLPALYCLRLWRFHYQFGRRFCLGKQWLNKFLWFP